MTKKKKVPFEILETGYTSYRVKIDDVNLNPLNPRVIEDDRFEVLVQSIKDEPHILKIRPIVVNKDMMALGGNQRLKACRVAGFDTVWILNADDIDDREQRTFIIADNADFGKWDEEILLKSGYKPLELERLGVRAVDIQTRETELPESSISSEHVSPPIDDEVDQNDLEERLNTYENNEIKQVVLYYPNEIYEKVCQSLYSASKKIGGDDNSEVVLKLIQYWQRNRKEARAKNG